jgi:hypothetical protein
MYDANNTKHLNYILRFFKCLRGLLFWISNDESLAYGERGKKLFATTYSCRYDSKHFLFRYNHAPLSAPLVAAPVLRKYNMRKPQYQVPKPRRRSISRFNHTNWIKFNFCNRDIIIFFYGTKRLRIPFYS